jgi:hypothetical protein
MRRSLAIPKKHPSAKVKIVFEQESLRLFAHPRAAIRAASLSL